MKTWGKKISVYIFFMFLSVFFVFFLYKTRQLGIDSDGSFHFSRVEEIYQNLKAGGIWEGVNAHLKHPALLNSEVTGIERKDDKVYITEIGRASCRERVSWAV